MIPEIAASVSAVGTIIELIKKVKIATDSMKDAELKAMMAEIINQASEVKLKLADANDEIDRLRKRIAELEEFEDVSDKVEVSAKGTILKVDHKGIKAGTRLCPACFSAKKILVPLDNIMRKRWSCPNCKAICTY